MSARGEPEAFDEARDGWSGKHLRMIVIGPPGTGKTHTILIAFLLAALRAGVLPERILCCSFTRAAATELRRRLAEARGVAEESLEHVCSTVHAAALRIIGTNMPYEYEVRGDDREARLDDGEVTEAGSGAERAALRAHDLARALEVPLREVARQAAPEYELAEIQAIVDAYQREKSKCKEIDYSDMIGMAQELPPPALDLLIVDEAQDCSLAQWRLIDAWAAAAGRVVLVGDPDQAIHEWAGAAPGQLLAHQGYEVRRLAQSHRVPRRAHALARALITRNQDRVDAPYEPAASSGTITEVDVAEAVCAIDQAALDGRQVLVLARAARTLGRYAGALADTATPFTNERGGAPLGAPAEVAAARAVVAYRAGEPAAMTDARALLALLPDAPAASFFTEVKKSVLAALRLSDAPTVTVAALARIGARLEAIVEAASLSGALRLANVGRKGEHLARLVERHGAGVLAAPPPVTLTSMHAAKGRQADLVVVDLDAPRNVQRGTALDGTTEAERRVLYVALTRTKDKLLLVRGRRHDLGDLLGLPPVVHFEAL